MLYMWLIDCSNKKLTSVPKPYMKISNPTAEAKSFSRLQYFVGDARSTCIHNYSKRALYTL